jgi:hypothetical protein
MRIISQNGKINLPYEMTALLVSDNYVQAVFAGGIQQSPYIMEVYESREKCQKAMEMLNRVYTGIFLSQNVEMSDDDYEECIKMAARGFGIIETMVSSPDVKFEPANIVFRFPKDGEI